MRKVGVFCLGLVPLVVAAQPSGVRGACKLFIKKSAHGQPAPDFGEFSAWTVIENRDGSYSVGGRYTLGNGARPAYTTCVIRKTNDGFTLVKLARMM